MKFKNLKFYGKEIPLLYFRISENWVPAMYMMLLRRHTWVFVIFWNEWKEETHSFTQDAYLEVLKSIRVYNPLLLRYVKKTFLGKTWLEEG